MDTRQMNAVYTSRQMKRRYEVWFLRIGLADGSGAWWFRYLLMNLGKNGCSTESTGMPVQVWATWFPQNGTPQAFIQGYPSEALELSARRNLPFHFQIAENGIEENSCWGNLHVDGHAISWKLRYQSDFGVVLSDKGWIGFSKSPHSNAQFSGEIIFDGAKFSGEPFGFGVQGHNCGYRHRAYWFWTHVYFRDEQGNSSTLEALLYDMPFGTVFRRAVWWHDGRPQVLQRFKEISAEREPSHVKWRFIGLDDAGFPIDATVEGRAPGLHRLPYRKTDCSGTFPVSNASLANAVVRFGKNSEQILETIGGAVLEMGGA